LTGKKGGPLSTKKSGEKERENDTGEKPGEEEIQKTQLRLKKGRKKKEYSTGEGQKRKRGKGEGILRKDAQKIKEAWGKVEFIALRKDFQ